MRTRNTMGLLSIAVATAALLLPLTARADDAWLGVSLQEIDETMREALGLEDRQGVLVSDVARRSPAEEAGLEDGDVIVEIDGRAATSARRVARAIERSDPGETVEIVIVRDGERQTLSATLEEATHDERWIGPRRGRTFVVPRAPRAPMAPTPDFERLTHFFSRPRLGVETRRLDEDLAPYFGVEAGTGVLVLEVMEDTPAEEAELKAGDVILRVDGESIDSPGDLRDLLLDFEGEKVTLDIKRQKEDLSIEVTLDEPEGRAFHGLGRGGRTSVFAIPGGDEEELREELESLREELEQLREEIRSLK